MSKDHREFISAKAVCERYSVTLMTLWRWRKQDRLGFPLPLTINGRRYWRLSDLSAWEAMREAAA